MSVQQNQPLRLVFPESSSFIPKKSSSNRAISFRYLILVAYIYGGVHVLVWLLSRTLVTPLFQQLVYDRREYHEKFFELLRDLNTKLSSFVPFIPPTALITYETPSGSRYADAQTQTNPEEEETKPNDPYSYITSVTTEKTKRRNRRTTVKFGAGSDGENKENSDNVEDEQEDLRSPAERANSETKEFVETVKYISTRTSALETASIVGLFNPVKVQLNELTDSVRALNVGDSAALADTLRLSKSSSLKNRKTNLDDVRKEIRSFKGSFLSARNFPTVRR
ncbi:uncharacterized protein SAPINGB_P000500 [Magnusiomyces paraingens]|uniref:Uncharacterized protein n=1 Tax=Magnusiomyces paraingens TaxID=2606893 RepID=A0A5E8B1N2_9ASCO|nr:uncharacterized protein SAPINGB_P000500 [Saprochaete ingens]VVT44690.1 unnamed protein product [Saprochaete ingens]